MPLTRADKEQIDGYLKSNQIHLARIVLQDHIKEEPFDEAARKVLAKINARYPSAPTPPPLPSSSTPVAKPPVSLKPPSPAAPIKQPSPSAPAPSSGEIDVIRQMIREKRYDDAEAMLILSDHPDADKLRERLVQIRSSGSKAKNDYAAPPPDFTNRLVICAVLLFLVWIPGLIAIEIWSGEARKSIDAPGARGLLRLRALAYGVLITVVFLFVLCSVLTSTTNRLSDTIMLTVAAEQLKR